MIATRGFLGIVLAASGLSLSLPSSSAQDQPKNSESKPTTPAPPVVEAGENSVSAEIDINQIDEFRRGRLMDEILRNLPWVGNFEMAGVQNGKPLTAISFEVRPTKNWTGRFNKTIWAVFVDERFVKFVDMESVDILSTYPIRVGTFPALQFAAKQPSLPNETIKKQIKAIIDNEPPPDPAIDLPRIYAEARAKNAEALRRMEKENAQLRDQFNAARLKIGMTKAEVSAKLKDKPLESGVLESGAFEIYGSTKPACAASSRAYHNILVLYRDDRLAGIYSGESAPDLNRPPSPKPGEEGIFTGLPPSPVKP
jgi:hypothetical protein